MERNDVKQVIVVIRNLKMRKGKLGAQASHASMAFLASHYSGKSLNINLSKAEQQWFETGHKKIVVSCEDQAELEELVKKARAAGIKAYVITDSGLTEFHGVPTVTCCAIGPDAARKIDLITGHLKLE